MADEENLDKIEKYKAAMNILLESFRATVNIAQYALRSSILINGGGAVALLAFIGNVLGKTKASFLLPKLSNSLISFSWGVLFSAVAAGTAYASQFFYNHAKNSKKCLIAGHSFHAICVFLVIISYVAFIFGIYYAYSAFSGVPLQN